MADPDIVETACARAWGVYRLINSGIDENDARRDKLKRFIQRALGGGRQRDGASGGRGAQISQEAGRVPDRLAYSAGGPRRSFMSGKNGNANSLGSC